MTLDSPLALCRFQTDLVDVDGSNCDITMTLHFDAHHWPHNTCGSLRSDAMCDTIDDTDVVNTYFLEQCICNKTEAEGCIFAASS